MKKGLKVEALKGISFAFPEKGFIFVVGKSGSGKSSMLNVLGLLDTYDSGEYIINGKCSKNLSEQEKDSFRAMNIGFVFQEFHIIDKYTIGQNISLPLEIQQNEKNDTRVKEVLEAVGLENYQNRMPEAISGGQKQRVAIARAIIKNPQIILADEPTGALDSVTGAEIFNILQNLSKEKLVIVISHDLESAHKYADQIIELKDGKIDKVYEGDGGAELVRMVVDKVSDKNLEDINNLLESGKKVVISKNKPKKQTEEKPKQVQPLQADSNKVKLPFKSTLKLSFFSVKSKWVRTFFTIFIAMFAIAFFGFADLISRFDCNNLIIQELNKENNSYINIGLESVEDYGIFKDYRSAKFYEPQMEKFDALNADAYKRRMFQPYVPMNLKNYRRLIPENQYYESVFGLYTECNDVSRLGLNIIAGREPRAPYEVMITTYHMQCYELFGFGDIEHVTDFDTQLKDKEIGYVWIDPKTDIHFKIVGLVEVDVSEYQSLADIKTRVNSISKEQEQLLTKFKSNASTLINNIFVMEGFHEILEYDTRALRLGAPQFSVPGTENAVQIGMYMGKINEKIFPDGNHSVVFKSGINNINDVGDDKVILSNGFLRQLIPEVKNLDFFNASQRGEFCEKTLGKKVIMTAEITGISDISETLIREVEIIGIWMAGDEARIGAVSQNLIEGLYSNSVVEYIILVANNSQRSGFVKTINSVGEFKVGEDVFRLFVKSENYREIRRIDTYFTLFVNVFSILAIILCVFSMILTYTFISQSIMLRKKDIGILRSLGARKADVAGIFIIEGIFIAILEILLGSLTCFVGYKFLDKYFISQLGSIAEQYNIVTFAPQQILLMAVATIVAVAVSICIPIIRISKKQPVDAIRN